MVDDDDQVADHLRVGNQHVVEGVAQLKDQRLLLVESVGPLQLVVVKHPRQRHRCAFTCWMALSSFFVHPERNMEPMPSFTQGF